MLNYFLVGEIALVNVMILVNKLPNIYVLLFESLGLMCFLVSKRRLKSAVIVGVWITYSILVSFEISIFSLDVYEHPMIPRMVSNGLNVERDFSLAILISYLLRNSILLGIGNDEIKSRNFYTADYELKCLLGIALFLFVAQQFVYISYFAVMLNITAIAILCFMTNRVNNHNGILFHSVFYIGIFSLLLLITRSRLPFAVIGMYLLTRLIEERKYIKSSLFAILILIATAVYGVIRTDFDHDGIQPHILFEKGISFQGEQGNVFIVAASLIGQAYDDLLPTALKSNVLQSILNLIPLSSKNILAINYMNYYYSDLDGGGFAYPLSAELYGSWGTLGVLVGGYSIGLICRLYDIKSTIGYVAFLIFSLQLFRQTLDSSIVTLISYLLLALYLNKKMNTKNEM